MGCINEKKETSIVSQISTSESSSASPLSDMSLFNMNSPKNTKFDTREEAIHATIREIFLEEYQKNMLFGKTLSRTQSQKLHSQNHHQNQNDPP